MSAWVWIPNIVGWPVIQLGIAHWILRRPVGWYERDSWLTRARRWEGDGEVYRRWLGVDRWKRLLPDGAVWMGGPGNKRLTIRSRGGCRVLAAETRRAEHAHWYMLLCTPAFFLWNPGWACAVMATYGVLTNVPCILTQRFNRMRVNSTLRREQMRRVRGAD